MDAVHDWGVHPSNESTKSMADAFGETALGFCAWCEETTHASGSETAAAIWLSKLYAAALALPDVTPTNSEGPPELSVSETEKARANLAHFCGWYYRDFSDTDFRLGDPPGMGDIGDDLLDTYKDIKAGCVLYQSGQFAEAIWHWKFSHWTHWGRHAAGAILALHCAVVSKIH